MGSRIQRRRCMWITVRLSLLLCLEYLVSAQIRYSVPEETKDGTIVGNLAKDLGLDVNSLRNRRFRIVSGHKDLLFQLNQSNGVLFVHKTIDREKVCYDNSACLISLKVAIENPLEIHYVIVEITDINDNVPSFSEPYQHFEIAEHTPVGTSFQLHAARDQDTTPNSVRNYKLSQNSNFEIDTSNIDEDKIPFLVLRKPLDRELIENYQLLGTAEDGGNPPKIGTLNITIKVLDTNDNRPVFSQNIYTVTLQENSPIGTAVITVNATDRDQGSNSDIEYAFAKTLNRKMYDVFQLDPVTGEIRVKGEVDFEDTEVYKLDIQASDKGQPPLTVDNRIIIKILDENDNKPEIEVTSLSNVVAEDANPGTVISLISVSDKDSGLNGKVVCSITSGVPFELKPSFQDSMYSLVTKEILDRETASKFEIIISATDLGPSPLSTSVTLTLLVSDVNDNRPQFSQRSLELYLVENNIPGASVFTVSAFDSDSGENAAVSYQIEGNGARNGVTSFMSINSETGVIYALKCFDFESIKTFQFNIVATDSGSPPLSNNVTMNVFILDQNDNAPLILHPVSSNGSAEGVEEIPRNVNPGHLVTKVRAYDADIGYNGWLLFSMQEVSDHSLFGLDRYTGQIRTLRLFSETDEAKHKLVILVKDNGNVSLSATATVIIKVVEPKEAFAASDTKNSVKEEDENNITFYLIITLSSVSLLLFISVIVLIAMQSSKSVDYSSKYLQDTTYDGTLCHSIQYRSGDKRYMLVGPRMSIGSVVPSSNGNTLVVPDRRRNSTGVCICPAVLMPF